MNVLLPMNVLLIDAPPPLEQALRDQGRQVKSLRPAGGVYSLGALLGDFCPDLVLQVENLGARVFIKNLEQAPCPTLFWAIDSHLNMYWHRWYALLFDGVLSPHLTLFRALPPALRPGQLQRMAWPGSRRPWTPHKDRARQLAFCGRLTAHRPIRSQLVELLRGQGLHLETDISFADMMALYDQSRVTPNESIALESNFRLLEAASSGCLVLSQDVGEDQDCLFAQGKEFLVYHDGLELLEQTRWAAKNPAAAEAMGRAARERVLAEHLPEHRALQVSAFAVDCARQRLRGTGAALALWLTLAPRIRNSTLPLSRADHAASGLELLGRLAADGPPDERGRALAHAALAQVLCLLAESAGAKARAQALGLCRELLLPQDAPERPLAALAPFFAGHPPAREPQLAAVGAALALREGELPLARQLRHLGSPPEGPAPADEATALCAQWWRDFFRAGNLFLCGFGYNPDAGMLPEDALGWLAFSRYLRPKAGGDFVMQREQTLAGTAGLQYQHMGALAECCLADADNWRLQLEYGLACLRCLRVEAGLHEMAEARAKALAAGQERAFQARVKGLRQGLRRVFTE